MKTYFKFFTIFFIISVLISCSSDDDSAPVIPEGDYFNGTLVLNEGGFSGGSSVSFIPSDLSEVKNFIFENTNAGEGVGVFPQSIFFEDDKAYIISNQSNLISVVNKFTFELIGTVDTGLNKPRYGTVLNGKAYVTNQVAFDSQEDDYIAVIDLETLEVEDMILVGATAETIMALNDELFIQNAAFGSGNLISKLNPSTNTITETLQVGDGLTSLRVYNEKLYSLDSEGVKVINPSSLTIESEIDKPETVESFNNLRIENDQLYYTLGTAAYSSAISASTLSTEVIFDYGSDSAFGSFYGFDVNNNQIYVADAGDFASNGTVFIYSISGELLADFEVGLSPNGFYFQ